ncbi:unnamed protein product [Meganyctiphanes norvegica]|uniref:CUB domain-containing protein n=1 Tax=Meganyctiphanes norvegica TaxID=48144 RepID=A0AAV2R3T0_MEGNR
MLFIMSKGLHILFSLLVLNFVTAINFNKTRDEKFLGAASPFTVARFANTDCDRDLHTGTCYTAWDCHTGVTGSNELFDTSTASKCQSGLGLCCVTILSCGSTSKNNNTYLRSPGFNGHFNYGLDCTQSIKIDDSICQLRLEINTLELNYPNNQGKCVDDYVKVNHDIKFEYLCGVSQNTHFYLDVDSDENESVDFFFHTSSTVSFNRQWDIRVQKIMCNTDAEVMRGCGQYFTGTSGNIRGMNMAGATSGSYVINNLNYAVCVRMELGYCEIYYSEGGNAWLPQCPDVFMRPGNTDSGAPKTEKCADGTSSVPTSYTFTYLAPHIFWLDTTRDNANEHYAYTSSTPNNWGSYDINYVASKTCS